MENEISDLKVELVRPNPFIDNEEDLWEIPLRANAWIANPDIEIITESGLGNWASEEAITHVFFHVKGPVKIDIGLECSVPEGTSVIEVEVADITQTVEIFGENSHVVPIGTFRIFGSGYLKINLRGLSKTGDYFGDVSHIVIPKKSLPEDTVTFINSEGDDTYWHRRGPSLHLRYTIPEGCNDHEYYYNEVMVPTGCDAVGSYFMAIGFNHGYFGIQVNSSEERRVLFSVWSPQETDNPEEVLEENEVILINKGDDVIVTVFGNEGTGGKSYLEYFWLPGVIYKFLLRGHPDPHMPNRTLYSAWFGEKDSSDWIFIAEFARPKTWEYLSDFHSFMENFLENESHTCRKAIYNNQWICDKTGNWFEVSKAKVTGDSTAEDRVRMDFEGGVEQNEDTCDGFYLKHCGFFVGAQNLSCEFSRVQQNCAPCIPVEKMKSNPQDLVVELIDTDNSWKTSSEMFEIPLCSNAWVTKDENDEEVITEYGLGNWMSENSIIHVFFFLKTSMKLDLFVKLKVPEGESILQFDVNGISINLQVQGSDYDIFFLGRFRFLGSGYVTINMKGLQKTGDFFADVSHILIPKDEVTDDILACIGDSCENTMYWARRGPSVVLSYDIPEPDIPDEFYYCEVLVPEGSDVIGSYFSVIGCSNAYFGIQVNSETERRVLFSVWSPQETDNLDELLEENKVLLVSKGEDVIINDFDNEGCGGQSILQYYWSVDTVYKFLLHGRPDDERPNYTIYSARFGMKNSDEWKLIAEWSRPKTSEYLTGFYSFAENFIEENAHITRRAIVGNQWVRKVNGTMKEVTSCKLSKEPETRVDFDVSVEEFEEGEGFCMVHCGFFRGKTEHECCFTRKPTQNVPFIDFENL